MFVSVRADTEVSSEACPRNSSATAERARSFAAALLLAYREAGNRLKSPSGEKRPPADGAKRPWAQLGHSLERLTSYDALWGGFQWTIF